MSIITTIGPKSDRKYRARWRTPEGASRSKTFARKVDAENFLTSIGNDKLTGAYVDPSAGQETVAEYAARWEVAQPWRQSSRDRVAHVLAAQIIPRFGSVAVRAVRPSYVQGGWGRWRRAGSLRPPSRAIPGARRGDARGAPGPAHP